MQAKDSEATIKALEGELKALQEKHGARNADMPSQIAALTSEKAGVERRLADQVKPRSYICQQLCSNARIRAWPHASVYKLYHAQDSNGAICDD